MRQNVPDPVLSDTQYDRFYHFDIPGMADDKLKDELWALRSQLFGLPARHWKRDRVQALEKESRRRFYKPVTQMPKGNKLSRTVEL